MPARAPIRVLYVEDDRVTALLFTQMLLEEPHIDLRVADDGAEALAAVKDWTPNALVLDAHLPDITGHALLGRLRALPGLAHVPAYMCSADGEPEDLHRAREAGFAGYWVKPVAAALVIATLLSHRPG